MGQWFGHDGDISFYTGRTWAFAKKLDGMVVYVKDEKKWYGCGDGTWRKVF